jgi:hypothetical protein
MRWAGTVQGALPGAPATAGAASPLAVSPEGAPRCPSFASGACCRPVACAGHQPDPRHHPLHGHHHPHAAGALQVSPAGKTHTAALPRACGGRMHQAGRARSATLPWHRPSPQTSARHAPRQPLALHRRAPRRWRSSLRRQRKRFVFPKRLQSGPSPQDWPHEPGGRCVRVCCSNVGGAHRCAARLLPA